MLRQFQADISQQTTKTQLIMMMDAFGPWCVGPDVQACIHCNEWSSLPDAFSICALHHQPLWLDSIWCSPPMHCNGVQCTVCTMVFITNYHAWIALLAFTTNGVQWSTLYNGVHHQLWQLLLDSIAGVQHRILPARCTLGQRKNSLHLQFLANKTFYILYKLSCLSTELNSL